MLQSIASTLGYHFLLGHGTLLSNILTAKIGYLTGYSEFQRLVRGKAIRVNGRLVVNDYNLTWRNILRDGLITVQIGRKRQILIRPVGRGFYFQGKS